MPIEYHEETQSWEPSENLTEAEKDSLIRVARDLIVGTLGEQLADRIMAVAMERGVKGSVNLDDLTDEEMGHA